MTIHMPQGSRAELLSSASAAALAAHEVMDKISSIGIPENPERTPNQTAVLEKHLGAANDNRAPVSAAA